MNPRRYHRHAYLRKGWAIQFGLIVCLLMSAFRATYSDEKAIAPYIAGEVVVGISPTMDGPDEGTSLAAVGTVLLYIPDIHAYRLQLPQNTTIAAAITTLQARPDVIYAEPNYIYTCASTPNDALYSMQYGPGQISADKAWDIWQPTHSITIAIIDSGVDGTHLDLTQKMLRSGGLSGPIIGYDATTSTAGAAPDVYGHGTNVAGIAAAQINNGTGIAGIAGWNGLSGSSDIAYTKIMPVRVLDNTGSGLDTTIANGITWAVDHGANVLNLSLYSPGYSSAIDSAVQYAWSQGCVIVACAGNQGNSGAEYPAFLSNVLSVAATDNTNTLTSVSEYGAWVNVAAPGANIFSTMPTYSVPLNGSLSMHQRIIVP